MMNRRDFLRAGYLGAGALAAGGLRMPSWGAQPRKATDVVTLGPDKVKLSRLAIGLGTKGGSIQRQLGVEGVADLLQFGLDQGLYFWDSADAYRTHPHMKEALKRIPREKVVIQTKTRARTADQMRADLDRFRQEVGTDYFDIVLLHACMRGDWTAERAGAMEVLSEAHQKGIVRTHGVSCHTLEALKTAAATPWVHVDLARINPAGVLMDSDPQTVIGVLRQMKAAGKGIIGMKILGEGALSNRVDEALRFAMGLDCVDCFTIGPADRKELSDLITRIPQAATAAAAKAA